MRSSPVVVALGFLLVAACSRKTQVMPNSTHAASTNAPATSPSFEPTVSPSANLPSNSKPDAPVASGEAHCLSEAERERDLAIAFKLRNELAVVRVAPDDVLWVRQRPGAGEKAVGKLSYDARDVTATGLVCRAGDTTWFEVSSGSTRGFANGSFLMPATAPVDETARFSKLAGASAFASIEALAQALGQAIVREQTEPSEVRFEAKLVGVAQSGARAVAVLHACCYADDSVMGEQIWLDAVLRNGRWALERARVSRLCPRGASGSACI